MFAKLTTSALLLGLALQAQAHTIITPALQVTSGTASRSDVLRASANNPCGNQQALGNIDKATAVTADANGKFVSWEGA
jgi:hypothetical protein